MKKQISLFIAVLLVLAGCNTTPAISTAKPELPTSAPEATSAINTSSTTSTTMTAYVDKRSGIAFDYPIGWTIVGPTTDDAVIYSYSLASYDLTNPSASSANSESSLPGGETKIDVTFYGADETPESASRTVQSDVDSGMAIVVKQETRTTPDGSSAYYYMVQGRLGGTAQVLYTRIDGHTVGIVAYGDGAYFEDVIKSLRIVTK